MKGKAGKPVEFGAKLDISVVDGFTRLEYRKRQTYRRIKIPAVDGTAGKEDC